MYMSGTQRVQEKFFMWAKAVETDSKRKRPIEMIIFKT